MSDITPLLQSATSGSRELDDAVLQVAGWQRRIVELSLIDYEAWFDHNNIEVIGEPEPTQSFDAIASLIDARGWVWTRPYPNVVCIGSPHVHDWSIHSEHPNFIINLCIAFLRARSTI